MKRQFAEKAHVAPKVFGIPSVKRKKKGALFSDTLFGASVSLTFRLR